MYIWAKSISGRGIIARILRQKGSYLVERIVRTRIKAIKGREV